jgi:ABC-type branched-subunit amino acid transport system permease subunit
MTDEAANAGRSLWGCANVLTPLLAIIWGSLFYAVASHYSTIAKLGYPDMTGAWDFWVYLPLGMALALVLGILVFNFVLRSAAALVALSSVALLALLPYVVMMGGGV